MILLMSALVTLALLVLAYRIRCAVSPYGARGRRRLLYWARGWWRGDQSVARDE